jgi:hypothetical protein
MSHIIIAWLAINAAVLLACIFKSHPALDYIAGTLLAAVFVTWAALVVFHVTWPQ